jgi:Ca2+:H+ antiporter
MGTGARGHGSRGISATDVRLAREGKQKRERNARLAAHGSVAASQRAAFVAPDAKPKSEKSDSLQIPCKSPALASAQNSHLAEIPHLLPKTANTILGAGNPESRHTDVLACRKSNGASDMATAARTPWWAWAWPAVAWLVLLAKPFAGDGATIAVAAGVALIATVFAAVYHAEVIAHCIGEPFGTLVLAVAVTVIEVALIASVMIADPTAAGLARDTVFAAVMIVCNGIVGLCLLWGGARHHIQDFHVEGASAALAVLAALTVLTMIVPNVVTSAPGPQFSMPQLVFAGTVSLALYGAFVFVQTVRHRDYFLPANGGGEETHAPPASASTAAISAGLLLAALVAVVGLAKSLTPMLERGVAWLDVPKATVGIVIAALVLLPEALAAVRAARANRLQTSLNLGLGSALASIGLTIPVVAALSITLHQPLELGLGVKDQVLLALTLLVGVITLGTGRTTVLQGIVHLIIFAAFLFFAVVP